MDLSSYMQFSAVLDNSGVSPLLRLADTSAYPGGVPPLITGWFSVTQPDGITVQVGSQSSPSIFWNGSQLVQASTALRMAYSGQFQNGAYSITYTIQASGYTASPLTKTFTLNYTRPTAVLSPNMDNFTPSLTVTDATNYSVANLSFVSASQTWSGVINDVMGSPQNISGSGLTFNLNYQGNYYDSSYSVTLVSIATWTLPNTFNWVTIVDQIDPPPQTFTTEIPPSLTALLTSLNALKAQLDGTQINGNLFGNSVYGNILQTYTYAVSLYYHLVTRGQNNQLAGLSSYVYQLQMIFNNGVMPVYVNTGTVIPAYNWGASAGSVPWGSITSKPSTFYVAWTVGDGGFPGPGATNYTDSRLNGVNLGQILVIRDNAPYTSISKVSQASTIITFGAALALNETMYILVIAL